MKLQLPRDLIRAALVGILLPSVLFLSFPPAIIAGNSQEIGFHREDLHAIWALFGGSATALAAGLLVLPRSAWAFVIGLTFNIIVWSAAFPFIWITTYWQLAAVILVEAAVFSLSIWIARRMSFDILIRLAAAIAVFNLGAGLYSNAKLAVALPVRPEANPPAPAHASRDDRFHGNVYHIILDAFSAIYLTEQLRQGRDPHLDGYTFYDEAIANYGYTNLSMRSVFTGSLHGENLKAWESAFTEGFTGDLAI